jgi:hypothetical protein
MVLLGALSWPGRRREGPLVACLTAFQTHLTFHDSDDLFDLLALPIWGASLWGAEAQAVSRIVCAAVSYNKYLDVASQRACRLPVGSLQANWRWYNKCQGLFFTGNPTTGACPVRGGHDFAGSGDYDLNMGAIAGTQQPSWRWCNKCQGLFFTGNPTTGNCPAGGGHNYAGSADYKMSYL